MKLIQEPNMAIDMEYQVEMVTPEMQSALDNGDENKVQLLLSKGANPSMVEKDVISGFQQSLLIKAISVRRYEIAQMLLQHGAKSNVSFMNYDADSLSIQEMTAKKMAQWVYSETKDSQVEKLIKQLSKHKDQNLLRVPPANFPDKLPPQLLIEAVRRGDIFLTKILVTRGMDVNLLDKDRKTGYQVSILISSISRCHVSISKFLIEKGSQTDLVFLNYDEQEDTMSKVTALSAAIEQRDKNLSNIKIADIVDILQRKIDETQHFQTNIVVAPNVPESLRPNVSPRRLYQPRDSVFTIPEIMIESVDSSDDEDGEESLEGGSSQQIATTIKQNQPKKPKMAAATPAKTEKRKFRKNKQKSEICTIL